MRRCVINDCCGDDILAPCCKDCDNIDCPDRCPKADDEYCANEVNDDKDKSRAEQD